MEWDLAERGCVRTCVEEAEPRACLVACRDGALWVRCWLLRGGYRLGLRAGECPGRGQGPTLHTPGTFPPSASALLLDQPEDASGASGLLTGPCGRRGRAPNLGQGPRSWRRRVCAIGVGAQCVTAREVGLGPRLGGSRGGACRERGWGGCGGRGQRRRALGGCGGRGLGRGGACGGRGHGCSSAGGPGGSWRRRGSRGRAVRPGRVRARGGPRPLCGDVTRAEGLRERRRCGPWGSVSASHANGRKAL